MIIFSNDLQSLDTFFFQKKNFGLSFLDIVSCIQLYNLYFSQCTANRQQAAGGTRPEPGNAVWQAARFVSLPC